MQRLMASKDLVPGIEYECPTQKAPVGPSGPAGFSLRFELPTVHSPHGEVLSLRFTVYTTFYSTVYIASAHHDSYSS